MSITEYLKLIKKRKGVIFNIIVVFLLLFATVTFVQTLKYSATSKLIIRQKYESGVDPYNTARSADYLSNILVQVISTESFLDEVLSSGFNIDKSYFPYDTEKKMKLWDKTVDAQAVKDFGIINIEIYHPNKYQAEQIARAVNYVLEVKNRLYHGGGTNVDIEILNMPVISRWPMKPNVFINMGVGLFGGIVTSLTFVYFFPEYELKKKKVEKKNFNSILNTRPILDMKDDERKKEDYYPPSRYITSF